MRENTSISPAKLVLTSLAFENNGQIPSRYTCDGDGINPPLEIGSVPSNTKSLVLIMDDPDAPAGVWDHWVKFNIPPMVISIEEGSEPPGISGKGTRGNLSYGPPCPPNGGHRYFFRVYALDTMLNLSPGATKKDVEFGMAGHILAEGQLVGLYSRK